MDAKKKSFLIVKITVDAAMIALFLLLMGYHLFENFQHEWFGASLFVLFIIHNVLNLKWYKNLFNGRYSAVRILTIIVNCLLLCSMLANIVSAFMLSRNVFRFLGLTSGSIGRKIHLVATVWSFLLMSVHFGLHQQMFIGIAKKICQPNTIVKNVLKWSIRAIFFAVCIYGIIVFVQREVYSDMFLLKEFKFMDFSESKIKFFADYISVFILFASVGHYLKKCLAMLSKRRTVHKNNLHSKNE
ncbi:MAG: DUF4405 domain-containing protein [Christensenellaceae bacterium]